MTPPDHALLSASGAHRWLNCTPSAVLESGEPDSSSAAAEQGTVAHALAEHKLRRALKQRSTRPTSQWIDDEMEQLTDDYVTYVLSKSPRRKSHARIRKYSSNNASISPTWFQTVLGLVTA